MDPLTREQVPGPIACVAWGSLVYNPGALPLRGRWADDGPELPVEFARQSDAGHITLVICPNVRRTRTYWVGLDVNTIDEARDALGRREYPSARPSWIDKNIGWWTPNGNFGAEAEVVGAWASARNFTGVVWTNLPCKFSGMVGLMPSAHQVLSYLQELKGEARATAEAYVRKAPPQTDTHYRREIRRELGWD